MKWADCLTPRTERELCIHLRKASMEAFSLLAKGKTKVLFSAHCLKPWEGILDVPFVSGMDAFFSHNKGDFTHNC